MTGGNTVETPTTMPGNHGGTLRRGGLVAAGPGRPKAREEAVKMLRAALFSDEKAERLGILQVVILKALKGDMKAIELCLAYGIGKPVERVELRLDVNAAAQAIAIESGLDADWLVREAEAIAREYIASPT